MITQKLISVVEEFTYDQCKKYGVPSRFHVELSVEKGQWLAKELRADENIVLLGTLLMDCELGKAYSQGKLAEHVDWGRQKAEELLSHDSQISADEKAAILACVEQHHGAKKFFYPEAEICCNADCYKFASVKGVIGGICHMSGMPLDTLVKLYLEKAEEKWQALTLDICKKDLEPQYKLIKQFLKTY